MRKKIFWSIFLIAAIFIILCSAVFVIVISLGSEKTAKTNISEQIDRLSDNFELTGTQNLINIASNNYKIVIVSSDNEAIYNSNPTEETDYSKYEDIKQARKNGEGEYMYSTDGGMQRVICISRMLPDGTVIHISTNQLNIWGRLLKALPITVSAIVLDVVISLAVSKFVADSICNKINSINLETPLENDGYDELTPLLTRIERHNRKIRTRVDKLKRRRNEFYAVTEGMTEGLILLGKGSVILSINKAAQRLFNTDDGCKGKNILTVYRSTAMQDMIDNAWNGEHGESILRISGREYRLSASPVRSDVKTAGVYILAVDITEKANAQRMRREFTANVSHELKTPLQSIMGTAELMENGLVKAEDAPQFISRIHAEAKHLVELVNDIIRLSQLDENTDFPREYVRLRELTDEAINVLSGEAEKRNISIELIGEEAEVVGVRRLIYEIIYNLCDNAVKYNKLGGSVKILIEEKDTSACITVSDTGIGIPKEYQTRIFERFYRVDKSHSRSTGGTGLGLSIVKHAVEYHNAKITIESEVGKGTSMKVEFPKTQN